MKTLYQTKATAIGGRDGKVTIDNYQFELAVPKELGGSGKTGVNPEQLFASGYAACFESAILHVARNKKIDVKVNSVETEVGIGPNGSGGFKLTVAITATLSNVDQTTADLLIKEADQVCPYSNAIRGNIEATVKALVV